MKANLTLRSTEVRGAAAAAGTDAVRASGVGAAVTLGAVARAEFEFAADGGRLLPVTERLYACAAKRVLYERVGVRPLS